MRCLVTGAAGFIGSHLAESLVGQGHEVTAVDCLTDYYDVARKHANVAALLAVGVPVVRRDLLQGDLDELLDGVDVVFHLAGQPGVRSSWGEDFADYVARNVHATQRLLEAARTSAVERFVLASSSSVYGEAVAYPTEESALPSPVSPYGVTKLAAEHLCQAYAHNFGIPAVALRYFTVFGPRQRPDMGISRFLQAMDEGRTITLLGTGEQVRDFTYVGDVVSATVAAGSADLAPGSVLNVAGGSRTSVNELLALLQGTTGRQARVRREPPQAGDVTATGASTELARRLLGWQPETPLAQGLALQWEWYKGLQRTAVARESA
jgi:nucleoside-diphosphate-sugar epimerase